jgi:hypothetical protein
VLQQGRCNVERPQLYIFPLYPSHHIALVDSIILYDFSANDVIFRGSHSGSDVGFTLGSDLEPWNVCVYTSASTVPWELGFLLTNSTGLVTVN